jgi:hypothetical protein
MRSAPGPVTLGRNQPNPLQGIATSSTSSPSRRRTRNVAISPIPFGESRRDPPAGPVGDDDRWLGRTLLPPPASDGNGPPNRSTRPGAPRPARSAPTGHARREPLPCLGTDPRGRWPTAPSDSLDRPTPPVRSAHSSDEDGPAASRTPMQPRLDWRVTRCRVATSSARRASSHVPPRRQIAPGPRSDHTRSRRIPSRGSRRRLLRSSAIARQPNVLPGPPRPGWTSAEPRRAGSLLPVSAVIPARGSLRLDSLLPCGVTRASNRRSSRTARRWSSGGTTRPPPAARLRSRLDQDSALLRRETR